MEPRKRFRRRPPGGVISVHPLLRLGEHHAAVRFDAQAGVVPVTWLSLASQYQGSYTQPRDRSEVPRSDDPALGGIRNAPPGASSQASSQSSVITVQLSRQHVVDLLRQANLTEMAEAALHDLPDPVDREDVAAWGGRWNIDMDYFINRMGGSP